MRQSFLLGATMCEFQLVLIASILCHPLLGFASDSRVRATIMMTRGKFLEGEPIGMKVALSNSGADDIQILGYCPPFSPPPSHSPIRFDVGKAKLTPRPVPRRQLIIIQRPLITIHPGHEWTPTIYLQQFLLQPKPGHYRIGYTMSLNYYTKMHFEKESKLMVHGELVFSIAPSTPQGLEKALKQYDAKLGSLNYCQECTAVEALSVVDDPIVIPHLVKMIKAGPLDYGFRALARFQGSRDAQAAVLSFLSSKVWQEVAGALGVLTQWKYQLKPDEVENLLKWNNPQVRWATVKYIETLHRKDYLEILKAHGIRPDADRP